MSLHPNLPALYRRKVEELEKLLTDPELAAEAMDAITALIRRVVLTPRADAPGLDAMLHSDLAEILALCSEATPNDKRPAVGTTGVKSRWLRGRATSFICSSALHASRRECQALEPLAARAHTFSPARR